MEERILNLKDKQKTTYCIPTWLRDEQIRLAIKRVSSRLVPQPRREDQVAIVGFGPSLNDTWEQIRRFKYVVSCSGSHKFLVDRGIIPTWHVEVDPRPHKVALIGTPQKETEYLIASTCNPKVFDHLEGYNVTLWHVFDSTEEGKRMLPAGEWALTGGCDVGMRAISIAAFLGFRDLHCFGLDGNARDEKHAAEHPNKLKKFDKVEYPEGSGNWFKTSAGMLEAAKQIWHELDQLPAVRAKFYGEGLIQTMAKYYEFKGEEPDKPYSNIVGFTRPPTISEGYRELNRKLHVDNLAYGVGGGKHASVVKKLCKATHTTSVLDYGCGKGYLQKELDFPIWEYDPAVPGKDACPRPADIVVCADVLEHVEPDLLIATLADLRRCVKQVGYFVIHTKASSKTLADGRNAHLIQEGQAWWRERLEKFFTIGKIVENGPLLTCLVGPKPRTARVSARAA